ncbi:MAG: flagellar assembly protein FliH [Proteobacteria bacterium]|nr:flagellar assembly protein FliH [Pseudomonadota bacterium]
MADFTTPKEQLTAFQRWELPSFDSVHQAVQPERSPDTQNKTTESTASAAAELIRIQQQAHGEGYAAGHQAGYAAGAQQAQTETALLQTLLQNLQTALTQVDEQLAQSLLDLSLEIAHKMIVETLQIKPEIILKIISSAISSLPHFNQNAHLILHPADAELVRRQMGEELAHAGWKIFTDTKIEQGGCRVETAHSNIDATNATRWQNIVKSIGQDKSWLMT